MGKIISSEKLEKAIRRRLRKIVIDTFWEKEGRDNLRKEVDIF